MRQNELKRNEADVDRDKIDRELDRLDRLPHGRLGPGYSGGWLTEGFHAADRSRGSGKQEEFRSRISVCSIEVRRSRLRKRSCRWRRRSERHRRVVLREGAALG